MIEEVERGNVAAYIVKDMSHIGRDHLRMGAPIPKTAETAQDSREDGETNEGNGARQSG